MFRKALKFLFPENLWTRRFTYWWLVTLVTLFTFDLLWMGQTTFRPLSFIAFYPYLFLNTTVLVLPAMLSRRSWIQAFVLLITDIIMIANLMYCRTYYNGIPAESYLLVGNLADFTDSVISSFRWYYAVLPFISIAAWIGAKRFIGTDDEKPRFTSYLFTLFVLCVLAWAADAWRGKSLMARIDEMKNDYKVYMCVLPIYQISGYVIFDMLADKDELTPEIEQNVNVWLQDHHRLVDTYYAGRMQNDSLRHPDNLIIILCESLESWVLEKEVEGQEVTPNLNRVIKDSATFYAPNVMTQVGPGRSIDGQLLVLTGLLPHTSRVYAFQDPEEKYFYSLPKATREQGGHSTLLTGDKPQTWNQRGVAGAFGMDTVLYNTSWSFDEFDGNKRGYLSDNDLMRQTVEKMKNGEVWQPGGKELIMIVTHSGHDPFRIAKHLRGVEFKENYSKLIDDYMIAANYTDRALGILIDYLKTRPDWDNTMVVITGDHEGLAKLRNDAMKDPNSAKIVDPQQHVPLIVLNSPVPGRFDNEMGQVDIYSTIIDLMGWYDYSWKGMGQSVFDPLFPGVAYSSNLGTVSSSKEAAPDIINHLKEAHKVSGWIIQYDLLRP